MNDTKLQEVLKERGIEIRRFASAHCGDGWAPLIASAVDHMLAAGWDGEVRQIKEKFGGLRFYIGEASEQVHKIAQECEHASYAICENCGSAGVSGPTITGWNKTFCEPCFDADAKERVASGYPKAEVYDTWKNPARDAPR